MTSANIVNQAFQSNPITPIVRSLASDTSVVALNIKVTSGAQVPRGPVIAPKVYFTTSSFALSSGAAPAALQKQALAESLPIPGSANTAVVVQTENLLVLGANLYVWTDTPSLDASVTLEIDVVEV